MMQSIADNQGVSRKYLDTIFTSLKNAGLVHSRRGIGGGHLLGKRPDEIRLGDILRAVEGPVSIIDCVSDPSFCARSHRCVTRDVWSEVTAAIEGVLDKITLSELVERHLRRQGVGATAAGAATTEATEATADTAAEEAVEESEERCLLS